MLFFIFTYIVYLLRQLPLLVFFISSGEFELPSSVLLFHSEGLQYFFKGTSTREQFSLILFIANVLIYSLSLKKLQMCTEFLMTVIFFHHFEYIIPRHADSMASDKKSNVNLIEDTWYIMSQLALAAFKALSLSCYSF